MSIFWNRDGEDFMWYMVCVFVKPGMRNTEMMKRLGLLRGIILYIKHSYLRVRQ